MPDRIIINFDDEKEKPRKPENKADGDRIIIDFGEEKKEDVKTLEKSYESKILDAKVNFFFRGNSHLNNSFDTELSFPEGIEQGFRKKFSINLEDEFFNSLLENNRYIILSSKSGSVYLIDRFTGAIKDKIFFENETFEKTGLVYQNSIYLNSLKKIFLLKEADDGKNNFEEIYHSEKGYFIWSNLNRYNDFLIFTEFNAADKKAFLKIIDLNNTEVKYEYGFEIHNFVSDKICIADDCVYVLYDSSLLAYDITRKTGELHSPEFKTDENSFIFYLNYRIYITSHLNELYYLDLPSVNYKFRYSGIKNSYINSLGGFADNIFIGTLDGWKFYKTSGIIVYNYEDEYENKIEAIARNILIVSQKNKIVFCNLNRFQEAEGYVLSSRGNETNVEIISAVFSMNGIFVLTQNGILELFTNDKLNIHI